MDHRFLFLSEDHQEVLAALSYFVKTKKGFAIVCGDVGTGKTMLINSFLGALPEYVQPIIVANPGVTSLELLRYIAKTLSIRVEDNVGILELTDAVKELLKQAKSLNKQFVLIIDEAHLLSDQALEEIRLLSNIETEDQKLLQILLVGQYELSYKLDRPQMRHLRQRININRFLSPMNADETRQYVDHRLRRVGSAFSVVFDDDCARVIYKMTGGVPRNINQLCDNALLICLSETQQKVDRRILRKAQEALLTDRLFTPPKFAPPAGAHRLLPRLVIWGAAGVTFLALLINLSQISFLGGLGQWVSRQISYSTGSAPGSTRAAVPSGGAKTPGMTNLPASSQPVTGKSTDVTAKVLASTEVSTGGVPVLGKTASSGLSGPPGQPPNIAEPVSLPPQVEKTDNSQGDALKHAFRRREVKKGDTLSIIASQVYKGSEGFGVEAVLLDNPRITNRDLIHPGEVVFLPGIKANGQIIQLRDNLFYAHYESFGSTDAMKRITSFLEQKGIKYTIIPYDRRRGAASHRILLGGYKTLADLQKAQEVVKAR
ncbi:MAG: AAA family ATPase [Deltaproteobacteria bacterium]|nr:AAA family ATPase [Deltaproteobacteria bacterium]